MEHIGWNFLPSHSRLRGPQLCASTWSLGLATLLTALPGCALKRATGPAATVSEEVEYMKMETDYEPMEFDRIEEPSPYFVKDGKPFCFVGTNNYYPMYKDEFAVTDLLDSAQALGVRVMRIWAFIDRGSLDGSMPNIREPGHQEGIYFQYWDPETNQPAYNEGEDGLKKLDFVVSEARKRGIHLIMVMTNNWRDFGGMDQYLVWYGLDEHYKFYTDERVKQAYKNWVKHLITRENSIDGTRYIDDPAIFSWELANEPRAINYENFDAPKGWDTTTITKWADEMSAYVKSLDPNHMVAVGDEGAFADGAREDAFYQGSDGVDTEALTTLPNVDFGTYHLYPEHWGKGLRWGNDWIKDHIALSRRANKPVILEEYGVQVRRQQERSGPIVEGWDRRKFAYLNWNNLILNQGGQGSMFWILSAHEEPGKLYPDYDHFTVYEDDITFDLLKDYADRMPTEATSCALAEGVDHGEPSPFVQARPTPGQTPEAAPSPPGDAAPGEETDSQDGEQNDERKSEGASDAGAQRASSSTRVPS